MTHYRRVLRLEKGEVQRSFKPLDAPITPPNQDVVKLSQPRFPSATLTALTKQAREKKRTLGQYFKELVTAFLETTGEGQDLPPDFLDAVFEQTHGSLTMARGDRLLGSPGSVYVGRKDAVVMRRLARRLSCSQSALCRAIIEFSADVSKR